MTKSKTSELTGAALDWAVAKAIKVSVKILPIDNEAGKHQVQKCGFIEEPWWPSFDWSQCGPLIAEYLQKFEKYGSGDFFADCGGRETCYSAPTPQIAICRAVVAAKLGDEVEIPSDLIP